MSSNVRANFYFFFFNFYKIAMVAAEDNLTKKRKRELKAADPQSSTARKSKPITVDEPDLTSQTNIVSEAQKKKKSKKIPDDQQQLTKKEKKKLRKQGAALIAQQLPDNNADSSIHDTTKPSDESPIEQSESRIKKKKKTKKANKDDFPSDNNDQPSLKKKSSKKSKHIDQSPSPSRKSITYNTLQSPPPPPPPENGTLIPIPSLPVEQNRDWIYYDYCISKNPSKNRKNIIDKRQYLEAESGDDDEGVDKDLLEVKAVRKNTGMPSREGDTSCKVKLVESSYTKGTFSIYGNYTKLF